MNYQMNKLKTDYRSGSSSGSLGRYAQCLLLGPSWLEFVFLIYYWCLMNCFIHCRFIEWSGFNFKVLPYRSTWASALSKWREKEKELEITG